MASVVGQFRAVNCRSLLKIGHALILSLETSFRVSDGSCVTGPDVGSPAGVALENHEAVTSVPAAAHQGEFL